MKKYYKSQPKHHVAVDCIIFGFDGVKLKLLVIKRDFQPGKGNWSLMGGFLQENESIDQAAERVLEQLTGLKEVYLEQLYVYGDIDRDEADRVISVAYYALVDTQVFGEVNGHQHTGKWFDINERPELIFDHNEMVEKALRRLRRKAKIQPVGFELLPSKFTLPTLMKLYEAIYQEKFDKRNFRKKMLSFGVINRLEEKDKTGSRKGAFLYEFDMEKYNGMLQNGARFVFS